MPIFSKICNDTQPWYATADIGGGGGGRGGANNQGPQPPMRDPCQVESDKSDAAFAQAMKDELIVNQGAPSVDWGGAFAIGQGIRVAVWGGSASSVGVAAGIGVMAKGSWFFGKAVVLSTYNLAVSNFHLLTQTAAGCPGSILPQLPDFSTPD